jgi:hypothetical protein
MSLLVTPKNRRPFWILLAVLTLSGPMLDIGERYNPATGYVDIPLGLDALTVRPLDWLAFWVALSLPLVALTWLALREYPGRVSLLSVNRTRPYWTIGVSIACVVALLLVTGPIWTSSDRRHWAGTWAFRSLAWAYWFLSIRSALVVSTAFAKAGSISRGAA